MAVESEKETPVEQVWRIYMTEGRLPDYARPVWYESKYLRPIVRHLPSDPRCRICFYPFGGFGGSFSRSVLGLEPSKLNPQICNICENLAGRYLGGTEVELSVLFADVRGSTALAENMSPSEFSRLINRFYQAATRVLFKKNGMVEKLIGDEVTGFFVPGFAGANHARAAVEAGEGILRATGHKDPGGPWVPVGVGVHAGMSYVGAVSTENGAADIAVLGDTPNTGAHLASQAAAGELLVSDSAARLAGMATGGLETRRLILKGREQPVDAWVKAFQPPG